MRILMGVLFALNLHFMVNYIVAGEYGSAVINGIGAGFSLHAFVWRRKNDQKNVR